MVLDNDEIEHDPENWSDSCSSDSSDSEEDTEFERDDVDKKLYDGSTMTVREFVLCMGLLKSKLNQPESHVCNILTLISTILPHPNNCPTSLYKFKKYFNNGNETILKKHYYCSSCATAVENVNHNINNKELLEIEEIVENPTVCVCGNNADYFIEIPLLPQLESLYRRTGFYHKLNTVPNNNEQSLKDIYDGTIYKKLSAANNVLSERNSISFMWYTDGIRIFKSAKFSIWGIFFSDSSASL